MSRSRERFQGHSDLSTQRLMEREYPAGSPRNYLIQTSKLTSIRSDVPVSTRRRELILEIAGPLDPEIVNARTMEDR
jgi:hypothetical protein